MEAIDYNFQRIPDDEWLNVDSSTLTNDQIDIEDPEDNRDRYTLVPARQGNVTAFGSCNLATDRPDKERKCQIRQLVWHGPQTQFNALRQAKDIHFVEAPEDRFSFTACEAVATMGFLSDFWEQAEVQEAFWRGIYSPKYKRKIIFSKTLTFKTSDLSRWKPKAIIGKRYFEDDDA